MRPEVIVFVLRGLDGS